MFRYLVIVDAVLAPSAVQSHGSVMVDINGFTPTVVGLSCNFESIVGRSFIRNAVLMRHSLSLWIVMTSGVPAISSKSGSRPVIGARLASILVSGEVSVVAAE